MKLASRLAVVALSALVGFLLVTQWRGQQRFTQRLEAESEGDLARILASLNTESDSLRDEIAALKLQLLTLQTSSQRDDAAVKAAQAQLDALQVLAGTVPAHGAGIVVRVDDPAGAMRYDLLVDVVQELRDAGAEAIAIDDVRVGATSSFADEDGAVAIDGERLSAPYRIVAIGQPDTLEAGLAIPGGAIDTLRATKRVTVAVDRQADVTVPALSRPPALDAARPVGS